MNEQLQILEQLEELRDKEATLHRQLGECIGRQQRLTRQLVELMNEQKRAGQIPDVKPFFPKRA